ncbi:hypothetical protein FRB90_007009 [Tulasnella sp. 427]|nr:hypothetical protein FRB90_007009 [Tulasnella sp. 427]
MYTVEPMMFTHSLPTARPTQVSLSGVSVELCIRNRPAELFSVNCDSHSRVVQAYIASQADEPYSVRWRLQTDLGCALGGVLSIDGVRAVAANRIVARSSLAWTECSGQQVSPLTERPFTFCELRTTDNERLANSSQQSGSGVIVLQIYRLKIVNQMNTVSLVGPSLPHQAYLIHERSKQTGLHMTSLGPERSSRPCSSILAVPLTPSDLLPSQAKLKVIVPTGLLRAAGIMPALSMPASFANIEIANEEGEVEGDEDHEQLVAEIAALRLALKTRIETLKSRSGSGEPNPTVKRQRIEEDDELDISLKRRRVAIKREPTSMQQTLA